MYELLLRDRLNFDASLYFGVQIWRMTYTWSGEVQRRIHIVVRVPIGLLVKLRGRPVFSQTLYAHEKHMGVLPMASEIVKLRPISDQLGRRMCCTLRYLVKKNR
jgi:hypothetical protein